jgi:hypothetical protein
LVNSHTRVFKELFYKDFISLLKFKTSLAQLGIVVHACNPSYLREGNRRKCGWRWAQSARPYLKNKAKRAGGVAQVVVHLPKQMQGPEFKPQFQKNKIPPKLVTGKAIL